MLTRRSASELLAQLADGTSLAGVARELGFSDAPIPLDGDAARALGIPEPFGSPALASGTGALRALLLGAPPQAPLRPLVARLAQRLTTRAPHQLWLALIVRRDGSEAAVAAWQPHGERARVGALVLDPRHLLDSDVETLLALHAAGAGADTLVHARWREILARDALSNRFYRALERAVVALGEGARGGAPAGARRELALLATSRLLFLSFLQGRGWLHRDADFLARHVDATLSRGGDVHRHLLEPLFFGTLNTPPARRAAAARALGAIPFLNGGLFARAPLERRFRALRFRDEEIAALFDDVLTRYRFTAREEERDWSEAAIDPEMLGRAFESLMASRERRDSGAYYTPHALVVRASDAAIDEALAGAGLGDEVRGALRDRHELAPADASRAREVLQQLRVLDPACGTGAFLVHILDRLTTLLQQAGDARPPWTLRRVVLTRSIFGVDINPMAAWLCELRLWLATVIEWPESDPLAVPPLPNLDRNIRLGDALAGGGFDDGPGEGLGGVRRGAGTAAITTLRTRYARATGARKRTLARALDLAERRAAIGTLDQQLSVIAGERRALVVAARGRDLFGGRRGALGSEHDRLQALRERARSLRAQRRALARGGALPFRFASHFADVAAAGGFDVVLGNPPWVRLHRIPAERREVMRREFRVFRDAAWKRGALDAGAGSGFAAQVDLAALFAERSTELLREGGVAALLLPVKLWRSLAGGGVRRLLGDDHDLRLLEDWSEAPSAFDAAVYPSLMVTQRRRPAVPGTGPEPGGAAPELRLAVHRRDLAITWRTSRAAIALDQSPGAPWLLLPPDARAAFARLAAAGPSMADSGLGRPSLGVKSGCNAAFLVRQTTPAAGVVRSDSHGPPFELEPALLRPVLRGEGVRRWSPAPNDERIVWTHDGDGRVLRTLPPLTARWLSHWRGELARRSDVRGGGAWWSLFRVDAADATRPRVVWADVSRGPRACILAARSPWIPLNSCYVVACKDDEDAAALAALLNSPLAASWLDAVAEPARGGYRRYLGWTVARLPIPTDWARAREILAPLGARGMAGDAVADGELLEAAITAYRVRASAMRPLLEWGWR